MKKEFKRHNIYLIKVYGRNEALLKLGCSSNIKKTLECYKSNNPFLETINTLYKENGEQLISDVNKTFDSTTDGWIKEEHLHNILQILLPYC